MSTAFNIFDYNRDGYLDLSVAAFSHIVPNNWHNSNNGPGGVVFYKNEGQCRFSRDTKDLNERNRRFTHAIGVVDSRNKERQDLWAATDFNLDRIFFQKDDDSYEQADEILYNSKAHNGMSVEPYYLSGDSYPSVFISQVYQPRYAVTGNQLWTFDGHKFVDSAKEQGVNKCGWAWGALLRTLIMMEGPILLSRMVLFLVIHKINIGV